jgi:hypothetical protein
MKLGLVPLAAVLAASALLAGCGGGSSSGSDPASVAPPGSPLFLEAVIRPQGELKSNVEALAKNVAGIEDPGALIVSKLETSLSEQGEKISYARDIEPWLGEMAGIFFERYDGSNFSGLGAIVQSTDTAATQEFVNKLAKSSKTPVKSASFKGVGYKVDGADGISVGVIGDFLVFGEDEQAFRNAIEASQGESLADGSRYSSAISAEPSESLLNVYADVGGLIEQAGTPTSSRTLQVLKAIGFDPSKATAVASVVPGSDQAEIELSTNAGGVDTSRGPATGLLGSLPSGSLAAFAASGFGAQLKKAIDGIDASGIPPSVAPHQLKSTLAQAGINLDKIAASIGDVGLFAEGTSRKNLSGALVLTTKNSAEATETVADIGLLLRNAGVAGLTAVSGRASGFSVRSTQLGPNPVVVATEGSRIAVGYGLAAALKGLQSGGSASTLADSATYKEAIESLGTTPISGFVDGPNALRLAESLGLAADPKFQIARPYISRIRFLALGSGEQNNLATTKLIAGFGG